jgi:hypothetical protein
MKMAPHGAISFSIPVAMALDDHDAVAIAARSAMPASVVVATKFGPSATTFTCHYGS